MSKDKVAADEYEKNLNEIINKIRANGADMVILSPYIMDTNPYEPMRTMMITYRDICAKVAKEKGLPFIDLQKIFEAQLKQGASSHSISGDRIHPSPVGHFVITQALVKELEH